MAAGSSSGRQAGRTRPWQGIGLFEVLCAVIVLAGMSLTDGEIPRFLAGVLVAAVLLLYVWSLIADLWSVWQSSTDQQAKQKE